MIPLQIAVLWHQHQPYYRKGSEFILPWVRLHGVKDYFDLPEILYDFPEIKQTFNLVPSLTLQLDEYIKCEVIDKIQRLTAIPASDLSENDKIDIINSFFLCNVENMILPHKRYAELYNLSGDKIKAVTEFSSQDWIDLQVWYNLAWLGNFSKQSGAARRLLAKGKNYSEDDKKLILELHNEILGKIIPQALHLMNLGQVELSCSPMYHPIIPLLCDSRSAHESQPGLAMPGHLFIHPDDAISQIHGGIEYFKKVFGTKPVGMWPSEGSISDESIDMYVQEGIQWLAGDEEILFASKPGIGKHEKYFPFKYNSKSGSINIFFRDHNLSDKIGFVYSGWNPEAAADDFCNCLEGIRAEILTNLGESALEKAVIPIILDGENCWEFYPENGLPFLKALYSRLSDTKKYRTMLYSEAVEINKSNSDYHLDSVRAGSWINANFDIWIGSDNNRKAWSALAEAREAVEKKKNELSPEILNAAMTEIYIAEGSDTFWWYCDYHNAPNKPDFDVLFRWRLKEIYLIIGSPAPEYLENPIGSSNFDDLVAGQSGDCSPNIDGNSVNIDTWKNSGIYKAKASMSAMHQIGGFLDKILFAGDYENIFFRFIPETRLSDSDLIIFKIKTPINIEITFSISKFKIKTHKENQINEMEFQSGDVIDFALSKSILGSNIPNGGIILTSTITTVSSKGGNKLSAPGGIKA